MNLKSKKMWRFLIAFILFAAITATAFVLLNRPTLAAWFDDSWAYRQIITLTNNGSAQTTYQVQVVIDTATLVTAGKLQSDCDDVRFTAVNGEVLPYWMDGLCNKSGTIFWVTIDAIAATTTNKIYFYYGNPSASGVSRFLSVPTGINKGTGIDGSVTISADTVIDTTNSISGRSCADGGDAVNYSVTASVASGATTVTLSSTPSSGCLTAGDEILIINLQGTSGDYSNVGKYEFARISSIATATLTLNRSLTNAYDGTTQKIAVIRVPNYSALTVNSTRTFSATAWNGTKYGVMAFRVSGTATITGSLSVNGRGFAGGTGGVGAGTAGGQGESYGGTGSVSQSANLGAGGGGRGWQAGVTNALGGGGGGYGVAGSVGHIDWDTTNYGLGGGTYGSSTLATMFLGSGGGGGGGGDGGDGRTGSKGGGIIFVGADTLTVSGTINAGGVDAVARAHGSSGGSGGGSGGSVYIMATTATLGSSLTTASGGAAASSGGAAGAGRIYAQYSTSTGTTTPTLTTSTLPVTGTPATEEYSPGPIAYWKFDDGTGITAQDSSVNNNDGTLTSGPTWQSENQCVSGKCIFFDGSDDKVTASAISNLSSSHTISMWIKPISVTSSLNKYIFDTGGGNNNWIQLYDTDSDGGLNLRASAGTTTYVDSNYEFTTANRWYHIVISISGTSLSMYVDGKLDKTGTSATGTSGAIYIGRYAAADAYNWNGFLDDIKIYNYARTADQVKTDYATYKVRQANNKGIAAGLGANKDSIPDALSNGLIGYWKMDESSGNAADSSGNSLTLTNNGTTTFSVGKFGNASTHNGSSQYLSTTTTISGIKTVAFWTNPASSTNYYINLIASTAYITSSSGTVSATGFTSPSIYVNGVLNGTITGSTWNHVVITSETGVSATAFEAGRANGSYLTSTSKLDDLRTYNRTLSPAEISQLYTWAPGPVGYWNFDEKTGTSASDRSGNGYSGTFNGTPAWSSGKFGSALNFNGSSDYISTSLAVSPSTYGELTMEAWVNPTADASSFDSILNGDDGGYDRGFGVNTATYEVQVGNTSWQPGPTHTVGAWQHVAVTYSASQITFYLNGVPYNYGSGGSFGSSSQTFLIGEDTACGACYYNGKIDEVKVYNYARTPKQIISDMNAGHPNIGSPIGSPLLYYKFDEGADNKCSGGSNDVCNSGSAGSGFDGAQSGMSVPATSTSGWSNSGKFNKAIAFDYSDDYISIPDGTATDQSGDFTLSVWINSRDVTSIQHVLAKRPGCGSANYQLHIDSGSVWGFYSGAAFNTTSALSSDTWYHLVATVQSSGAISLYTNGVLSRSGTVSLAGVNSGALLLGAADACAQKFKGSLDEFKLYNYALTADEVKIEYNRGSAVVLGALGTNPTYAPQAANQEYCIPGDTSTCTTPAGEWNLDEKTGQYGNDTSGNGRYVTLGANASAGSDEPNWISGRLGAGFQFDGTDDTAPSVNNIGISSNTARTISAWVQVPSFAATGYVQPVVSWGACSSGALNVFGIRNNGPFFWGYGQDIQGNSITTNTWYHITFVYDGASAGYIYVNGKLDTSGSISLNTTNSTVTLGGNAANCASSTVYYNGKIDQVRVYGYARTTAQIAWDYNRGGPVGWWKFDECQGTTAYDASVTNTNNGTITIGASGEDMVGTCTTSSTAWGSGATGKFNSSLSFDGTDDYMYVSDQSVHKPTYVTLSAWVYLASAVSGGNIYAAVVKEAANTGYGINILGSSYGNSIGSEPEFFIGTGSSVVVADSNVSLATNTWYHIVGVYDGSSVKTYINGSLRKSTSTGSSISHTTNQFDVGRSTTWGRYFAGQIDDVRIYNYPLTATQIKLLYNDNAAVRFGPSSGTP